MNTPDETPTPETNKAAFEVWTRDYGNIEVVSSEVSYDLERRLAATEKENVKIRALLDEAKETITNTLEGCGGAIHERNRVRENLSVVIKERDSARDELKRLTAENDSLKRINNENVEIYEQHASEVEADNAKLLKENDSLRRELDAKPKAQ